MTFSYEMGRPTVQRIKQEIEPVLIADSAAAFPRRLRDMASTLQRCRSWRPLALTRWRSFCGIGMTAPWGGVGHRLSAGT